MLAAGCGIRCPESQKYDEALDACVYVDGAGPGDVQLGGQVLYEWTGGDGGFSPSVVYYPSGDITNSAEYKLAVAFQTLATDGTGASAIHVLRLEQIGGEISAVDEVVRESTGIIGTFLSMGYLPVSGKLVIAYYDETEGKVYTAWERGLSDWTITQVDGQDFDTGAFVDLAVDPYSDTVHLAYLDLGLHDLRYAMLQDAAVILGGLDPSGLVDTGVVDLGNGLVNGGLIDKKVSIAVGPLGDPVIAYYDESSSHLRVAQYDSAADVWYKRVIGTSTTRLLQPDPDGRVVLDGSYVNWPEQMTLYKDGLEVTSPVRIVSDTQIEIPDYEPTAEYELSYVTIPSANYGQWNDTAIDENGALYVAYFDFQRQSLGIATSGGSITDSQWEIQIVDSSGAAGNKCVLAIRTLATDSQVAYQPVVAYFDGATADVRVAYRRRATWNAGDVDSKGWTGLDIGMAAGLDGYVAVAYSLYDFDTQTYGMKVYRFLPDAIE